MLQDLSRASKKHLYTQTSLQHVQEQEVTASIAVTRKLSSTCGCFAVRSMAAQHLVCHLRVELNWKLRTISSAFLLDTITTFPSCLFRNSPQFFPHFNVFLCHSFLLFHPVLSYTPSFYTLFLYILYLSSALPWLSLLASRPSFFPASPSPGSPSHLLLPPPPPSPSLLVTGLMAEVWYDLI